MTRLEARVRWLTAQTTFLTLAIAGLLMWEFFPRNAQVEASRFVLRDARWVRRAELGFLDDGSPALKFVHPNGRTRLALQLSPDGAGVLRMNDAQVERLRLGLTAAGTPMLALRNSDGLPGVAAAVDASGQPTIRLEEAGRAVWLAPR
jgi:hypothetical protein